MCAGVWNKMEKKNPLHLSEGKRMAIEALPFDPETRNSSHS